MKTDAQPKPPKTPMCDKLSTHHKEVEAIQGFLEWAAEQGLEFARFHKHSKDCCENGMRVCGYSEDHLEPHRERIQTMVMRFLEIDEKKLERERTAILDHHCKVTGQG